MPEVPKPVYKPVHEIIAEKVDMAVTGTMSMPVSESVSKPVLEAAETKDEIAATIRIDKDQMEDATENEAAAAVEEMAEEPKDIGSTTSIIESIDF